MVHRLTADPAPGGETQDGETLGGENPGHGPSGGDSSSAPSAGPHAYRKGGGDTPSVSPDLHRLRSLLLQDDRTTIAKLEQELAALRARVGDDAAFGQALESVLVDTLNRLHKTQAAGLRRVLAPVVVKTIRSEVRNSREELVNALYPLTGKMVAAAMRDAVRKLTDNINESVERASNPMLLYARLRAKLGGRPVASELLERKRSIHINRAILINRVSGTVECSFSTDDEIDDDMVGGLISALSAFATETYARSNADLRMIELEGRQLLLRHSPLFVLAVEVDGEPAPLQVEAFDALFMALMTEQDADPEQVDDQRLQQFVRDVETWRPQGRRPYWRIVFMACVAAALAGAGYHSWRIWAFEKQVGNVQALVAGQESLNSFGVQVSGDRKANVITVRGLVPAGFDRGRLRQQAAGLLDRGTGVTIALQPIEVEGRLSRRLAQGSATLEQLARSQSELQELTQALRNEVAVLEGRLGSLQTSVSGQAGALALRLSALETTDQGMEGGLPDALADLKARMDEGAELALQSRQQVEQALGDMRALQQARLKTFVERSYLRFANGVDDLDPYASGIVRNGLADAIIALDKPVEILGHADVSGSVRDNLKRGLNRARAVKRDLVALGVPEHLLKPRSMGASQARRAPGPGSEDRRVTFKVE